MQAHKFSYGI